MPKWRPIPALPPLSPKPHPHPHAHHTCHPFITQVTRTPGRVWSATECEHLANFANVVYLQQYGLAQVQQGGLPVVSPFACQYYTNRYVLVRRMQGLTLPVHQSYAGWWCWCWRPLHLCPLPHLSNPLLSSHPCSSALVAAELLSADVNSQFLGVFNNTSPAQLAALTFALRCGDSMQVGLGGWGPERAARAAGVMGPVVLQAHWAGFRSGKAGRGAVHQGRTPELKPDPEPDPGQTHIHPPHSTPLLPQAIGFTCGGFITFDDDILCEGVPPALPPDVPLAAPPPALPHLDTCDLVTQIYQDETNMDQPFYTEENCNHLARYATIM